MQSYTLNSLISSTPLSSPRQGELALQPIDGSVFPGVYNRRRSRMLAVLAEGELPVTAMS